MKKDKRIKNKRHIESSLPAVDLYGLTEDDLTNKSKLDEAYIRYQADLILERLKKKPQKKTGRGENNA